MTARTLWRETQKQGVDVTKLEVNDLTQKNVDKVTRYRSDGNKKLLEMVNRMKDLEVRDREGMDEILARKKVEVEEKSREKQRETPRRGHW